MSRRIYLIALLLAVAGLSAECIALIHFPLSEELPWIIGMFKTLRLSFFPLQDFHYFNSQTHLQLSYLDLAGYAVLLVGAIIYKISEGREVRLVRFIIAIILFCAIFSLLSSLFALLFHSEYFKNLALRYWVFFLIRIVELVFIARLAWSVMAHFKKVRPLFQPVDIENKTSTAELTNASFLSRLQHHVFDSALCIAIFIPATIDIPPLYGLYYGPGGSLGFMVLFAVARLLYYAVFEILLQATPGKLLTETRVVTRIGTTPSAATIITRSACRLIPFNAFSFLGRGTGWHDSFSGTRVVDEEQQGVPGYRYYVIIPIGFALVTVGWLAKNVYSSVKERSQLNETHAQKISKFQYELARLSTDHVIRLDRVDRHLDGKLFIKVESMNSIELIVAVLQMKEDYSDAWIQAEEEYLRLKSIDSLILDTIPRAALENAYTVDYKKSQDARRRSVALLNDGHAYEINRIARFYAPDIEKSEFNFQSNTLSLQMHNYGHPATITAVEIIEGSLVWADNNVDAPSSREQFNSPSFTLNFRNNDHTFYKIWLSAVTDSGKTFYFMVEGKDLHVNVSRVD